MFRKRRDEEAAAVRNSLRGRLNPSLFGSGVDSYGETANELLVELLGRCRDLGVRSAFPKEVDTWIKNLLQSIPGWDFEPVTSALGDAANFAGFEEWGDFDNERLEQVVSKATTRAASEEAAFANADIAPLVVLAVLSWARPRTEGFNGFDEVTNFVREQPPCIRLDSLRDGHAVTSLIASGHFNDIGEEKRREFYDVAHLQAWDTGMLVGCWYALDRLPAVR